jgi:hypothetical protein
MARVQKWIRLRFHGLRKCSSASCRVRISSDTKRAAISPLHGASWRVDMVHRQVTVAAHGCGPQGANAIGLVPCGGYLRCYLKLSDSEPRPAAATRHGRLLKKSAAISNWSLSMAFPSDDIVEFQRKTDFFSSLPWPRRLPVGPRGLAATFTRHGGESTGGGPLQTRPRHLHSRPA